MSNIDILDTSNIVDFSKMFENCTSLTSINFPTDMSKKHIIYWRYNNSGFCKIDDDIVFEFGDSVEIEQLKNDKTLVISSGVVDSNFTYYNEISKQFPEYFV